MTTLEQAAKKTCTDPLFVYDTIYLAVIKTKQKYKKLANKERAVDVCISLMKQPKKHVKESFSSVEDCIEKALAAKVVPWRWIVSAVAVVLAMAIILPFCLPEKPLVIDPVGFVMENTESFSNSIGENETYVKNYHNLKDLGGPDSYLLTQEAYWGGGGRIQCSLLTTQNGITYFAYTYIHRESGKEPYAQIHLYRADASGWVEVAQIPVGLVILHYKSSLYGGEDDIVITENLIYQANSVELIEYEGTIYIISAYNEGVQIHHYSECEGVREVARIKLAESMNFRPNPNEYDNNWLSAMTFCFNEAKGQYDFLYGVRTTKNRDEAHVSHFSFNPEKESVSEVTTHTEDEFLGLSPIALCADEQGTLYFFNLEMIGNLEGYAYGVGSKNYYNFGLLLYRYDGVSMECLGLVTEPNISAREPVLCRYENGALEIVCPLASTKTHKYFKIINGEVAESYKISPAQSYTTHEYLGFFFLEDQLCCLEMYEEGNLIFSRTVPNTRNEKIAEIKMPLNYWYKGYNYEHKRLIPTYGNIFNYLFVFEGDIYFGQIVLDPKNQ